MDFVLSLHSNVRWVIVVVSSATIVKLGLGWRAGRPYEPADRILTAAFAGMMDLQALLGIIYLLWAGIGAGQGFPAVRVIHALIMVVAVAVSHLPARWKDAPSADRYRAGVFSVLAALVLIVIGVSVVPRGWA